MDHYDASMVIVSNEWVVSLEFEMVFPGSFAHSSKGLESTLVQLLFHMMPITHQNG